MDYWFETSRTNLLPLSQEQDDFQVALKEWEHTGKITDHVAPVQICQLCEHPKLRYHFEILNRHTRACLQVGSSCIEKFDITVYDDKGQELYGKTKSKQLREEIKEKQREMMLEPLRELWQAAQRERDTISAHVKKFKRRGGFSPMGLYHLFGLMKEHKIAYTPPIYRVVLRSNQDKGELLAMSQEELDLIWSSLSVSQKQRYVKEQERLEKQEQEKVDRIRRLSSNAQRKSHHQPAPIARTTPTKDASIYVPDAPIRYVERAHKYMITFIDSQGAAFERLFRGDLRFCRNYVESEIKNYPEGTKVEICVTRTKELVHEHEKS
ncbi:MAG: hypothetical protein GY847_33350 [Proteobacteria bacterium]|nr:hypothetical protein [Pseudomonadota bacterium]